MSVLAPTLTVMVLWLPRSTVVTDTGGEPGTMPVVIADPTRDNALRAHALVSLPTRERPPEEPAVDADVTLDSALETRTLLATLSSAWAICTRVSSDECRDRPMDSAQWMSRHVMAHRHPSH